LYIDIAASRHMIRLRYAGRRDWRAARAIAACGTLAAAAAALGESFGVVGRVA
jgi:hypothetical protein